MLNRRKTRTLLYSIVVLMWLFACLRLDGRGSFGPTGLIATEFLNPTAAGSSSPFLSKSKNGTFILSWLEPASDQKLALRFASLQDEKWSAAQTVAESAFFNRHPAVLPSVRLLANGSLVSYWTHRRERGPESEEIYLSRSTDGGKHWAPAVTVPQDSSRTEHSLVSMAEFGNEAAIIWLDARNEKQGKTLLMERSLAPDGKVAAETVLHDDVCACCPTASAATGKGIVVVYRNHTSDNIRDIYFIRQPQSGWSEPQLLHPDNWQINGCPTNSADLATDGNQNAAVAWFTAANEQAHVKVAFSTNAGDSFGEPIIADQGNPVGHVSVALMSDGSALLSWIERSDSTAKLLVRRVNPRNQQVSPSVVVATGTVGELGYPRIVGAGTKGVLAWPERGSNARVHTAFVSTESSANSLSRASASW